MLRSCTITTTIAITITFTITITITITIWYLSFNWRQLVYPQFPSQDSGFFGPNPWKILAPPSNYLSTKGFLATQPLAKYIATESLVMGTGCRLCFADVVRCALRGVLDSVHCPNDKHNAALLRQPNSPTAQALDCCRAMLSKCDVERAAVAALVQDAVASARQSRGRARRAVRDMQRGPDHPGGKNIPRCFSDFSARAGLNVFPYETSLRSELRSQNISKKI